MQGNIRQSNLLNSSWQCVINLFIQKLKRQCSHHCCFQLINRSMVIYIASMWPQPANLSHIISMVFSNCGRRNSAVCEMTPQPAIAHQQQWSPGPSYSCTNIQTNRWFHYLWRLVSGQQEWEGGGHKWSHPTYWSLTVINEFVIPPWLAINDLTRRAAVIN